MNSDMVEDEDVECPLCLDTLSFDDLSFFPCSCGYQICRFCWHHIKANLNGRCPACRKPYDDAAVEFKPMKPEELKRLQAAKKQREKEKKDAEVNARRHAANVRVRQRAQVHIQGMTTRIANEDTLAYLKGPDQFGRFGKILKLFFSRRAPQPGAPPIILGSSASALQTPTSSSISSSSAFPSSSSSSSGPLSAISPFASSSSSLSSSSSSATAAAGSSSSGPHCPVNVYINYSAASEATACINAIDGTVTPDGHRLKATWGTTRYCPAYLRGVKCTNDNCMQAHEPGEELESGTHPGGLHQSHSFHSNSNSNASGAGPGGGMIRDGHRHVSGAHGMGMAGGGSASNNEVRETREEMVNLKHAYKEQANKEPAPAALPATASWASRPSAPSPSHSSSSHHHHQQQHQHHAASAGPASVELRPSTSSSSSASNQQQQQQHAQSSTTTSHAHSSSISSRLPKAQNHPLPPRPPSRTSSVDVSRTRSLKDKERERDREQKTAQAGAGAGAGSTTNGEDTRRPQNATAGNSGNNNSESAAIIAGGKSGSPSNLRDASHLSNVIAPPTPPVSEPSSTASGHQQQQQQQQAGTANSASTFPPGLGRPLTPVSEFERTLGTFGSGSFAFNLAANEASPLKGKERLHLDEDEHGDNPPLRFNLGEEESVTSSSLQASREGSPQRGRMHLGGLKGLSAGNTEENGTGDLDDSSKMSYQGPFDPFAPPSDTVGKAAALSNSVESASRPDSPSAYMSGNGTSAVNGARLEGPPGLSRANTNTSSQDGFNAAAATGARFGPPPGLEESSRHRSRFGFARPGSTERLPSSIAMVHPSNSGSGTSIPVADLFKGLNGVVNGGMSPIRPGSAQSSGSGSHGAFGIPPPGLFSPPGINGHSNSNSAGSTPALSMGGITSSNSVFSGANVALPPSSSTAHEAHLGVASSSTPGKQQKKASLTELFPGIDLSASFTAPSALPPSLVKTLGISLENINLQATNATDGRLPDFAPLNPGQGGAAASLPLPPKAGSGTTASESQLGGGKLQSTLSPNASPMQQQQQTPQGASAVLSHGGLPPGLGTSRQAQQAHAQNAQQAHQAHLAAQQAQAAAAAAAAAAAQAQQQHQHAQQHQQQPHGLPHMYGRPPSAASAGSKHSQDAMFPGSSAGSYMSMQHATSPPLIPGGSSPYADSGNGRFQDPAIISFANMNGFAQPHMQHNPYGSPFGLPGLPEQASPGGSTPGQPGGPNGIPGPGQGGADFYNRYHPLPAVQSQSTYNPYIPVGPVGMPSNVVGMPGGLGRMQASQTMSPAGAFGMLRR